MNDNIELMSLFFIHSVCTKVRPRFFDQVGHGAMYASSRNKHFSLNLQNYEESRQKLGAELGNKVP